MSWPKISLNKRYGALARVTRCVGSFRTGRVPHKRTPDSTMVSNSPVSELVVTGVGVDQRTYKADLYGLFLAQYGARREAREAGYHKRTLDFWVFTEEENALFPHFYLPVTGSSSVWPGCAC